MPVDQKTRRRLQHVFGSRWVLFTLLLSIAVALPLFTIATEMFSRGDEVWRHILYERVPTYALNTLWLLIGVGFTTIILGVGTAWLVSMFRFPGRNLFRWALIMPIAIPAYINGFTWAGMLDYTSPLYAFLRNNFGLDTGTFLFFDIMSLPGAIFILSISFYPYVYLITRAYFQTQSATLFEVGASLGHGPWRKFFHTALPLGRPAIVAGVSLALMEVLNDYGVASYYGVDTFTTGIFSAWFAFGDISSAMKLSGYLMIFVFVLIFAERSQRGQMRYGMQGIRKHGLEPIPMKGLPAMLASLACSIPLLAGFILPAIMLLWWSAQTFMQVVDAGFWTLLRNSFFLAGTASLFVVSSAIFIAYTVRSFKNRVVQTLARITTLGYAIPGAVVAVGVLIPFLWLDNRLIQLPFFNTFIITGTWLALIYAYLVRFMAVGYNSIDSGMEKIPLSMDEAARSLGMQHGKVLGKVHFPLLTGAALSAFLLTFIDVLKELPLTLILRPFNFDTLAIRAFEYASDERVAEAAPYALVIVFTGMIPVLLLNRFIGREPS
ncbi:MAG: iron ABC transporter permease [Bacteroidia bacterium]|nr:MAG: iron ABC transporter permease [Bacteroidia bacterium]